MRNFDKAKRIVIKIGTNILTKNDSVDAGYVCRLAYQAILSPDPSTSFRSGIYFSVSSVVCRILYVGENNIYLIRNRKIGDSNPNDCTSD
jgi:hypothetical protein